VGEGRDGKAFAGVGGGGGAVVGATVVRQGGGARAVCSVVGSVGKMQTMAGVIAGDSWYRCRMAWSVVGVRCCGKNYRVHIHWSLSYPVNSSFCIEGYDTLAKTPVWGVVGLPFNGAVDAFVVDCFVNVPTIAENALHRVPTVDVAVVRFGGV
jgi:hypothetical protein